MQKLTGVITESCLDDHEQIEISSSPLKDDYDDLWISHLKLEKKEKILESRHAWINDTIMDAAQTLLKELTRGQISGWQATLYCQRLTKFETIPHGSPCVQIMHACEQFSLDHCLQHEY